MRYEERHGGRGSKQGQNDHEHYERRREIGVQRIGKEDSSGGERSKQRQGIMVELHRLPSSFGQQF